MTAPPTELTPLMYARGKQTVVKKRKKNKRRNARLKHGGE